MADRNHFKADLREFRFLLFEQLRIQELLGHPPYQNFGRDEAEMVLTEINRFATEVTGPLNTVADREGCKLDGGRVTTPPGFKDAWRKLYDAGWKSIALPEAHGGQGAPTVLHALVEEFLAGSCVAFCMYPGLAYGGGDVIANFGTREQQATYMGKMFAGQWGGTMCLTEPHAGSDVGAATSSARSLGNGMYAIRGTKVFITGGDHDLTENIIHLVLARIDGAPPGTKGLSLFVVPKIRVNADGTLGSANDVTVGSIEHKMGLNGSCTCVLNFGENDACVGELLGTQENVGMSQMFQLMNSARIAVGLQGLGVASTAYLNGVAYAKERKQGAHVSRWKDALAPRVPIIEHPDVRRMLLDCKARVEGIRALIFKLAMHLDRANLCQGKDDKAASAHRGQVDLLVPIVKSYSSDQAFRICETIVQVYGGAGYLEDHPIEQYLRDSKVFSIYEGTNHIQAMDLVGRKLGQNGGSDFRRFLSDVTTFATEHSQHPKFGSDCQSLGKAAEALGGAAMQMLGWFQCGTPTLVPLNANRFLEMMAETVVAWQLLEAGVIAEAATASLADGHPDRVFYAGKTNTAQYFARNSLPEVIAKAKIIQKSDDSALTMPDDGFATS